MAIIYSDENNVNYLVAENDNLYNKRNLSNLARDTYIANIYALNQSGLPMRQSAGFPQRVSVSKVPHTSGILSLMIVIY